MEKVNFINSRGLKLVGDLYDFNSDYAVILCHGFTGDRHEWGKFDELANILNAEGYSVLTFDFSGSGESDNDSLTIEKEIDDLNHAIKFINSKGKKRISLVGLSLGGLVSASVCDDRVGAMVLYAPVTSPKEDYELKRWSEEQKNELKEKGYITLKMRRGFRKIMKIDKQMIRERESVNQKNLLSKIKIPTLILHGSTDSSVSYKDSVNAIKYLPKGSELKDIPGDDHFDDKNYKKFFAPTVNWLKSHFKKV